ncbi:MAG: hypothetical protein AAFQ10_01610 [Pseudomonadota bacterium]
MTNTTKKTFAKVALAATMATTIIASSMSGAQAGKRERNIALGVAGAIIGAAIVSNRAHARPRYQTRRYARDCWYEREEIWSHRRGRYVIRKVRVCD